MKANKQTAWNIWFNNVLNAKVTYMAAHDMTDSRYHPHLNRHLMQYVNWFLSLATDTKAQLPGLQHFLHL